MALSENQESEITKEVLIKVLDPFLTHFNIITENGQLALACSFQTLGPHLYKERK